MTADFADWDDEHLPDHRRRLQTAMFVSLAIHGLVLAIFAASPPRAMAPVAEYLAIDLVAAPARARPAPTPSAPPRAPAPPPAVEPAPPPPIAKAPVQVLPEQTPGRIREAKPEPPRVARAKPVEPAPAPRRRRRQEASVGDDKAAMAALMQELGGDDVSALLQSSATKRAVAEAEAAKESAGASSVGVELSPEQAEWNRMVEALISKRFVDLPRYRGRGLRVVLEVGVSPTGIVSGEPTLRETSGELSFDRQAMAAVSLAGPLPPPPEPGRVLLILSSEAR